MKRKVIGIIAALLLASVGTAALVGYVRSAKDEAVAGEELVSVYVLTKSVDKGATADDIRAALSEELVPLKVRADDAFTYRWVFGNDSVAAVDLKAGEQLLASRIVGETTLARVPVPDGLQELTIALEPQRAVGGDVRPGDTVGVLLSFDPFERDASGETASTEVPAEVPTDSATATTTAPTKTPNVTHLELQQILVTRVQFVATGSGAVLGDSTKTPDDVGAAPSTDVLVTLAVSAGQAEQVVFAGEFGHIWLTAENKNAVTTGTRIVTLGEVYTDGSLQ